jgi:7,8-dihydropterin-6-yl-methyl-4-(beta-D-ribofuranosyl)aminobenzene 5'-phosphate synthase
MGFEMAQAAETVAKPSITVLYDNYNAGLGLQNDWGFACFIRGFEKNILFDTGAKGEVLLENMKKMRIDPQEIDIVILSHGHSDHIGGLDAIITANKHVEVYLLGSFLGTVESNLKKKGISYSKPKMRAEVCEHVYTTGLIKGFPDEHCLVLETPQGNILITGCAHPGIEKIVTLTKNAFPGELLLVMGGFHLQRTGQSQVEKIISAMQGLGVKYVAPSHCTGDLAIRLFANAYQDDYIPLGVGKVIEVESLL